MLISQIRNGSKKEEKTKITSIIPMTLHIPILMRIFRIILLIPADLNLLEPPLRQNRSRRSGVTPQVLMLEPQPHRGRMYPVHLGPFQIIHNLHLPVIMAVTDHFVPLTRHFVVELRHGRDDCV